MKNNYMRWRATVRFPVLSTRDGVKKINGFRVFLNVAPIAAANRRRERLVYSPAWGTHRAIRERMGRELNLPVRYWGDIWQRYRREDMRVRLSAFSVRCL